MSFELDGTDFFFIFILAAQIILYGWMHFRRSSGKAMNEVKYGDRMATMTRIAFIAIFAISIAFILGKISGLW